MRPTPLHFARLSRERDAFTLIELLVVMAIIAMLAAFLFPVMGMVRSRADSTQCLSQFRQIGSGMAAYIGDHNECCLDR